MRGIGTFEDGVERCRIQVTARHAAFPEHVCRQINLGYRDPASIDVEEFANREDEGVLLVPQGRRDAVSPQQSTRLGRRILIP